MSKTDVIRSAMMEAMKAKDKPRKDSLAMLLNALKNAEIDKREPLTDDEAHAIIKKEIRQTQETHDTAPENRTDIKAEAISRMAVFKEFVPEDMSAEQIEEVIRGVLKGLNIDQPTGSDKGNIMKVLMPLVKGKADGKLVNEILSNLMK